MIRLTELKLPLDHADTALADLIAHTLGLATDQLLHVRVHKRSFDARKHVVSLVYIAHVELAPELEAQVLQRLAGHPHIGPAPDLSYHPPVQAPATLKQRPVVVGFGPCGIFAALLLAQMGFAPIVIERGKKVRERTKDTWGLWRKKVLNPESNVQFGEGGAGTFSDGKLYSQIKDPRHLGRKVMNEFVKAGAPDDILYTARPHIGTFKLVKVVEHMREQIIALGGEIRFQERVCDLRIEESATGRHLRGLVIERLSDASRYELDASHVVLALGHSSRDTVEMLHRPRRAHGGQAVFGRVFASSTRKA